MKDEWIDIINDNLSFVKACLKSKTHKYGWLHATVHIWFYTNNGQILLQKRSETKIAFPNLWDISVAGHISSGESKISAAIREIQEEIGLKITEDKLEYIGTFRETHRHGHYFTDNEVHFVYLAKLDIELDQLKIQQEELSALKLIPLNVYQKDLKKPNYDKKYVPHYPKYYDFVLNEISKRL